MLEFVDFDGAFILSSISAQEKQGHYANIAT